jgi:hypothetical protein
MAPKIYFYQEDGKTKKYCYCSLCGKGPFKEDEINSSNEVKQNTVREIAGQHTKIYYCNSCDNFILIGKDKK